MTHSINCDQLHEAFDYDACLMCKHFRGGADIKTRWRCSLNQNLPERSAFHMIWLEENAINAGIMQEEHRGEIAVNYVGKKRRQQ